MPLLCSGFCKALRSLSASTSPLVRATKKAVFKIQASLCVGGAICYQHVANTDFICMRSHKQKLSLEHINNIVVEIRIRTVYLWPSTFMYEEFTLG